MADTEPATKGEAADSDSVQRLTDEQGLETPRVGYAELQLEVEELRAQLDKIIVERNFFEQQATRLAVKPGRDLSCLHDESVQLAIREDLRQALEKVKEQLRIQLTGSRQNTLQDQASFEISNDHCAQDGASSSNVSNIADGKLMHNDPANAGSIDFQTMTDDFGDVQEVINQIMVKSTLAETLAKLAQSKAESQDLIAHLDKTMDVVERAFFEQKVRLLDGHGDLKSFTPAQLDKVREELQQALTKVEEQLRINLTSSTENTLQQQQASFETGNLPPGGDGASRVKEGSNVSSTPDDRAQEMQMELDRAFEELRGFTEEAPEEELEALVEKLDEIGLGLRQ